MFIGWRAINISLQRSENTSLERSEIATEFDERTICQDDE
jgi:hypothetical protein